MGMPGRGFARFVGECWRVAWTGSVSQARALAGTLGLLTFGLLALAAGVEVTWAPGLLSGGLITVGVFATTWAVVILARLVWAPYRVWRDERDAREKAEAELQLIKKRDHLTGPLLQFYREGRRLAVRGHDTITPTDKSCAEFKAASVDWERRTGAWIDANMRAGASDHFSNWNLHHPERYSEFIHARDHRGHEWEINKVSYLLRNLDDMVRNPHWDRH